MREQVLRATIEMWGVAQLAWEGTRGARLPLPAEHPSSISALGGQEYCSSTRSPRTRKTPLKNYSSAPIWWGWRSWRAGLRSRGGTRPPALLQQGLHVRRQASWRWPFLQALRLCRSRQAAGRVGRRYVPRCKGAVCALGCQERLLQDKNSFLILTPLCQPWLHGCSGARFQETAWETAMAMAMDGAGHWRAQHRFLYRYKVFLFLTPR